MIGFDPVPLAEPRGNRLAFGCCQRAIVNHHLGNVTGETKTSSIIVRADVSRCGRGIELRNIVCLGHRFAIEKQLGLLTWCIK